MHHKFDHEKLDVYRLELRFISWVTALIEEVKKTSGPKVREVCDHLDRASLSSLFNTAEGSQLLPDQSGSLPVPSSGFKPESSGRASGTTDGAPS